MSKQIIGALVSGILLFLWQFLSWSMLNVHQDEFKYTPNQDKILQFLSENLSEEGGYFMPGLPPGSSQEEHQANMNASAGKPWATINYHKAMDTDMVMPMVRGFIVDVIAAWLLIWLLIRMNGMNFQRILTASIVVGLIGYLTIPYLNSIWFETNSMGYLIDTVVQWGLVGLWLGWWLPRK